MTQQRSRETNKDGCVGNRKGDHDPNTNISDGHKSVKREKQRK